MKKYESKYEERYEEIVMFAKKYVRQKYGKHAIGFFKTGGIKRRSFFLPEYIKQILDGVPVNAILDDAKERLKRKLKLITEHPNWYIDPDETTVKDWYIDPEVTIKELEKEIRELYYIKEKFPELA
ncbi:MAG: hypothetical protein ACPLSA_08750 [Caldanaerobacter sp.]